MIGLKVGLKRLKEQLLPPAAVGEAGWDGGDDCPCSCGSAATTDAAPVPVEQRLMQMLPGVLNAAYAAGAAGLPPPQCVFPPAAQSECDVCGTTPTPRPDQGVYGVCSAVTPWKRDCSPLGDAQCSTCIGSLDSDAVGSLLELMRGRCAPAAAEGCVGAQAPKRPPRLCIQHSSADSGSCDTTPSARPCDLASGLSPSPRTPLGACTSSSASSVAMGEAGAPSDGALWSLGHSDSGSDVGSHRRCRDKRHPEMQKEGASPQPVTPPLRRRPLQQQQLPHPPACRQPTLESPPAAAAAAAAAAAGPMPTGSEPDGGEVGELLALSSHLPVGMAREGWRLSDFVLLRRLYQGYASCVYQAHDRVSKATVALKVYHLDQLGELNHHQVHREVALHASLRHPHIIALHAAFRQGERVVMVQEYAGGGDLYALLRRAGGRLLERQAVVGVLRPFLSALAYLHQRGIVHRDVKPENVLFTSDRVLKVADFGLAIDLHLERAVTRAGTLDYMAPEVVRCPAKERPADNKGRRSLAYNAAVDAWAVGVFSYELVVGFPPFVSDTTAGAVGRILAGGEGVAYPRSMSADARAFIASALQTHPGDRPRVADMLDHPWMSAQLAVPPQQLQPQQQRAVQPPASDACLAAALTPCRAGYGGAATAAASPPAAMLLAMPHARYGAAARLRRASSLPDSPAHAGCEAPAPSPTALLTGALLGAAAAAAPPAMGSAGAAAACASRAPSLVPAGRRSSPAQPAARPSQPQQHAAAGRGVAGGAATPMHCPLDARSRWEAACRRHSSCAAAAVPLPATVLPQPPPAAAQQQQSPLEGSRSVPAPMQLCATAAMPAGLRRAHSARASHPPLWCGDGAAARPAWLGVAALAGRAVAGT